MVPVEVPPLRSRPEDIELLVKYFMQYFSRKLRIDPLVLTADISARFLAYEWPGNVRELKNFIERSMILGYFPKDDLPLNCILDERADPMESDCPEGLESKESLEQVEKTHILKVLASCQGNKSEAARRLGISRKTLERKCVAWSQE